MNIFLVPFTWTRHVAVSLVVGAATLLVWWLLTLWAVWLGPATGLMWKPGLEGAIYLGMMASTIAATSVIAEGSLRRRRLVGRVAAPLFAGISALSLTLASFGVFSLGTPYLLEQPLSALVAEPTYVTLRFRILMWAAAGFASGMGPMFARLGHGFVSHVGGGIAAGLVGAAVWHGLAYHGPHDLYLASAMGPLAWGVTHGLLTWGIPAELYAGWVRVISGPRGGLRIPIDGLDGEARERFVGHYPRGLDLFLPIEDGVAELHVSFVADGEGNYAVRGLSQAPTLVRRFLERIDVRYDARRPAPLETGLQMEDRVVLSTDLGDVELELEMLPKEER